MSLTKKEIDDLRGLANRLGTTEAAEEVGVHKTSIIRALAGLDIRPRTEDDIREALKRGSAGTVTRGETSAKSDKTRRGAR